MRCVCSGLRDTVVDEARQIQDDLLSDSNGVGTPAGAVNIKYISFARSVQRRELCDALYVCLCVFVCAHVRLQFFVLVSKEFNSRLKFSAMLFTFFLDLNPGLQREISCARPAELTVEAAVGEQDGGIVLPVIDTTTPIMR
jgi:hypothetical protein